MFQLKRWNKGVIQGSGRDLEITISRPGSVVNGLVLMLIFLPMVCWFIRIFFVPFPTFTSAQDFLGIVLFVPFVLGFRRLFEREFATQIVTVNAERITQVRRTKFWMRTKHLNSVEVTDVANSKGWGGFGSVHVSANGRRHTILDQLLIDDAIRLAREISQAVGQQHYLSDIILA